MSHITIQLSGIAAELVLGNYMPADPTIMKNWEEFYHYNDLIHTSQLLLQHINSIEVKADGKIVFSGRIPPLCIRSQKSFCPVMVDRALYLRTECAEEAVYSCEFDTENFDLQLLTFETQDYDFLFKVGNAFLDKILYNGNSLTLEWQSGKPVGNICLLCRYENGYLVPLFDAINKKEA